MIPIISGAQSPAAFEDKQGRRTVPLVAYCSGGPAINDVSSLYGYPWVAYVEGTEVRLRREDSDEYTVLLNEEGLEFISLAFDQQMNPVVSYMQSGVAKFRWYNAVTADYVITSLPAGTTRPFVALDLREQVFLADADMIVTYIRDGNLYSRVQRENYDIEHLSQPNAGQYVVRFGRNTGNRLQWRAIPLPT